MAARSARCSGRLVLPDVAWHGALASGPGASSSSRAADRSSTWGRIISRRCAICSGPVDERAGEGVDRIRRARRDRRGTQQGQPHHGRDADHDHGAASLRVAAPTSCFDELGRVEARPSADRTLWHRWLAPRAGPEFLRRRGGSHRTRRRLAATGFLEPALRQAELAVADLARQRAGSGQLSLPWG